MQNMFHTLLMSDYRPKFSPLQYRKNIGRPDRHRQSQNSGTDVSDIDFSKY